MPNYNYVIDSSFRPYSLSEMLQPLEIYSNAYKESEAAYDELKNADIFSYLDTLDDSSKAKRIYQRYASDLDRQVKDFTRNGLNMGNRSALTGLRLRYKGEIGQLERAKEKLDKEIESRNQNRAKGLQMLYANDNPSIDDYLGENTPNLYGISTEDLRKRGIEAAASASSRLYGNTRIEDISRYYQNIINTQGYSPEVVNAFRNDLNAIPELRDEVDRIMSDTGAEANLKGMNRQQARAAIVNGIINGMSYKEDRKPEQNPGVMTAAQAANYSLGLSAQKLNELTHGYRRNPETGELEDMNEWMYSHDENGNRTGYNPMSVNGYERTPDGRWRKESTALTQEAKTDNKKQEALLKLDRGTLANSNGFDVTFDNDRQHYDWIGAISKHGDKWYSGKEGDDNPGHNFPGAWGWASTSNVEDMLGNFTYEPGDKAPMRILSKSEVLALADDADLASHINQQLYSSGYFNDAILKSLMSQYNYTQEEAVKLLNDNGYKYTNDYQVAAVNSEWPHKGDVNYLVAVRTK